MIPSKYETVVIPSRSGKSRHVHVPGSNEEPLCLEVGRGGGRNRAESYVTKPSSVIPDGYYPDCRFCLREIGEWSENGV